MRLLGVFFLFISFCGFSQDCSHLWQSDLATGTEGPKGYMGDTHAGYGVFSFFTDSSKYFVLKGKFPKTRFFSVETYKGKKNYPKGSLFDSKIIPDTGSQNPFWEGVSLDVEERSFTIVAAPEGHSDLHRNQLPLSRSDKYGSIWVRFYSPSKGIQISLSDLPRIEAYDLKTGAPTSCPKTWTEPKFTPFPQFLGYLSKKPSGVFPFELFQVNWAGNSGVGKYAQGHSQMNFKEVALIRFKPPTFVKTFAGEGTFDSRAQLRYWSICAIDLPGNRGLWCFADHQLQPDNDGFVTIASGTGTEVEAEALKRGYYFIPDLRPKDSVMSLFAFRNILPSTDFGAHEQYQGDYNPKMRVCSKEKFLDGSCEWWD